MTELEVLSHVDRGLASGPGLRWVQKEGGRGVLLQFDFDLFGLQVVELVWLVLVNSVMGVLTTALVVCIGSAASEGRLGGHLD